MTARIVSLHRYPVKGFPAEGVARARLEPGAGIPGDRVLAVSDGTAAPVPDRWNRWSHFFALKKRPDLAAWSVRTDPDGTIVLVPPAAGVWSPAAEAAAPIRIDPADPSSRSAAASRIAAHLPGADPSVVDVLTASSAAGPQGMFDSEHGHVSLIFLDTVRALARADGRDLDPARFRGNLLLQGLAPFAESDLVGAIMRVGDARLLIRQTIERCTATTVHPDSAVRDLNVPRILATRCGHIHCGLYGEVLTAGEVRPGDALVVEQRTTDRPLPAGTGPRSLRVLESSPLDDGRHHLRLADPYGWFAEHWRAGRHVRVHLTLDGDPHWRSYTAVLVRDSEFSLLVRPRGPVSRALTRLRAGDRLTVSGPFGGLTPDSLTPDIPTPGTPAPETPAPDPLVILTAGVGVTTALSLLPGLPADQPVSLVHLDRNADPGTSTSVDALRALAQGPGRDLLVWDTGSRGRPGPGDLQEWVTGASAAVVCGGADFVQAVAEACTAAGLPATRVHREAFASPQDAARLTDFSPATVVRPDGSRLRWTPESGTLLEALEADGAQVTYSCRAGSCGTCAIRVDDPQASAAVQDETAQPGPGRILACARVPVGSLTVLSED